MATHRTNDVDDKSSRRHKESRRPDMAIYKPGQSRLGRKSEVDTVKSCSVKDEPRPTENIKGDGQEHTTKTVNQKLATSGEKGSKAKQTKQHHPDRQPRDDGRSSVRHNDTKNVSRDHTSGRDGKTHNENASSQPRDEGRSSVRHNDTKNVSRDHTSGRDGKTHNENASSQPRDDGRSSVRHNVTKNVSRDHTSGRDGKTHNGNASSQPREDGRSSVRHNDTKNVSRDHTSGRDGKTHNENTSSGNTGRQTFKPKADRGVGYRQRKDEINESKFPIKTEKIKCEGDEKESKSTDAKTVGSPENKSVGEHQPATPREKGWLGPQGKRKNVKEVGSTNQETLTQNSEKKYPENDQENTKEKVLNRSNTWSGKQSHRQAKETKGSQQVDVCHGQSSPETISVHHEHQDAVNTSDNEVEKSQRQKKPERPFYSGPKLANKTETPESTKVEVDHQLPETSMKFSKSEDRIETMVFTSRKPSNQNRPRENSGRFPKNATPQDSKPEDKNITVKNEEKKPFIALMDLNLSPSHHDASSKPPQSGTRSQSPNNKSSGNAPLTSKRYSARRSRQQHNSESSTGSDTSQTTQGRSDEREKNLTRADSQPRNSSLKEELSNAHESVSSPISSRFSRTVESKRSKNQPAEGALKDVDRAKVITEQGGQLSEKLKLSVTFNSEVREVKICPEEEDRRMKDSRGDKRNHRERESTLSESEHKHAEHTSKSGGIIRLTQTKTNTREVAHSQMGSHPQMGNHPHSGNHPQSGSHHQLGNRPHTDSHSHHYKPIYDKHYPSPSNANEVSRPNDARGRHANRNLLWDPSKPQEKPALASKKAEATPELHFFDPEHDASHSDPGFDPRQFQTPVYNPYYPSHQTFPTHPGVMHPPPGFTPSMSWAERVEEHSTTPQVPQRQSASSQIHNYEGNFPLLGSTQDSTVETPVARMPPLSHSQSAAMRILQDSVRYEHSLNNAVSRRFHGEESVQKIIKLSQEVERMYEQVVLTDLETCNKHNVEQLLWKTVYYQLIEALKRQDTEEPGMYRTYLEQLLDHGNDFYVALLDKLQSSYGFRLEVHTGLDPLHEEPRRTIKLALLSAQRCLIALGDIARYKELTNDTNNYGKARSWYLKAQHLAPRNGRPYNQLAILALYTRRKLDAVYYYMRSLAASNPFLTARESLMTLFEEVRRKVEHKEQAQILAKQEKERAKEAEKRQRQRGGRKGRSVGGKDADRQATRREIWIASDGSSYDGSELPEDEGNNDENEEEALKRITPVEINKRFILSLLNVHGKLFTKIGMEHFDFITERLLTEFSILLSHSPTPLTSARLVQAMAINMFAAHNTETRDHSVTEDTRSMLQEQSIQLGLDMFGLLVHRCNQLLTEYLKSDTKGRVLLSDDLVEFLPAVKVYADWLMCHPHLWNPPPNCSDKPYSASLDVWTSLADMLNTLKKIDISSVRFIKKMDENDCQEILLPEDVQLSGFVPLIALPLQPVYIPSGTDKMEAMDCVRIMSLLLFGDYACGQETPLLAYDVTNNCYISVAPELPTKEEHVPAPDQQDDDVIIEDDYYEEDEDSGRETNESDGISGLRQKKENLERRLHEQQQKQAQIQAAMDSHHQQRGLELEIRPLYLVPDTNCFIDRLTEIQSLLACRKYKLVVPLVVINELDGLAKGNCQDQQADLSRSRIVSEGAELSLRCLEEKFEQRNKYLRALTSKGTVMDTIAYRSEEVDFKGCNDDLILRCCLHYVDDRARDFMPTDKSAPIRLYRDVVLLTNDRNLRVKALQQNVPVKEITAFAKWAKV